MAVPVLNDVSRECRLRVLHVIPSISSVHGGPTRALQQMVLAMATTNVALDVATTDDDGRKRRLDASTKAENPFFPQVFYFRKATEFYKVAPSFLLWFWRNVRSYDAVHIHALFSFVSVTAAAISMLRRAPYILRPLGTLSAYGVTKRRPLLKRLSLACIEGPLLRRAAAVHFTSDAELRDAADLGLPIRGVVIPLAAEPFAGAAPPKNSMQSGSTSHAPTILYLSRLDPKKNLEGLLRAMQLVCERLPTVRLVVAGGGEPSYVSSLHRLATELGVSSSVDWAGFVEGDAKTSLFRRATIYVLPSFSENFGIAVAEALAAGLPCVVSTGVALSSDIAEYGAGVVVPPDSGAIAEAVINLLGDAQKRELVSANATRLARERFSVAAMRIGLSTLYNRVSKRGEAATA